MRLILWLAALAIIGFVIVCAVSMNDWTPNVQTGFQRGNDQPNPIHIERPASPFETAPLVVVPEKTEPPTPPPEVKPQPVTTIEQKKSSTSGAYVEPERTVDDEALVLPPRPDDPMLAWQYETTVMEYLRLGQNRHKKWDQATVDALYALARHFSTSHDVTANEVLAACEKAIQLGTSDRLVNYAKSMMRVKLNGVYMKEDAWKIYLCGMILHNSQYSAVRRCYGLIRGLPWLQRIDYELKDEAIRNEYIKALGWVLQDLEEVLKDKKVPLEIVYDACIEVINLHFVIDNDRLKIFERVKTLLEKHRSGSSLIPAVTGRFYIDYGWDARGYSFASEVSPEGWKLLAERLALANKYLDQAFTMDKEAPEVIPNMIAVCMGSGNDPRDVNLWFNRGLEINPDNYQLYSAKLYCLQPRWHGTAKEMIELGRDCVRRAKLPDQKNKEIVFILSDAHDLLSDDFHRYTGKPVDEYWKQPGVWEDIKLVYDTYLGIYPNATFSRGNFARYACLAEQWKSANKQFEILGIDCPPGPFEGEAKMNAMRLQAAAKGK